MSHSISSSPLNLYKFPRIALTTHPYTSSQPTELSFHANEYIVIFDELDSGYCDCEVLGTFPWDENAAEMHEQERFCMWIQGHLRRIYHEQRQSDAPEEVSANETRDLRPVRGYVSLYFVQYVKYTEYDGIHRKDPRNKYEEYYRGLSTKCNKCKGDLNMLEEKWHTWDLKDVDTDWCDKRINYCSTCYHNSVQENGGIEELVRLSGGDEVLRPDAYFFSWRKHPSELAYLLSTSKTALTLDNIFHEFANRRCYGTRERIVDENGVSVLTDQVNWVSYSEVYTRVRHFAAGLRSIIREYLRSSSEWDIETRPMVGICSVNREDWFVTDLSCIMYGMVSVPLPRNKVHVKDKSDIVHMINHAKLEVIVCEKLYLREFVNICTELCPTVRVIVQMEPWEESEYETLLTELPNKSITLFSMQQLVKIGETYLQDNELSLVLLPPDALLTIVYTSGSTNRPKGVIVTEKNMHETFSTESFSSYHTLVTISFHPLSHISDRQSALITILCGGQVAIFSGDMETIYDDFRVFNPILLSTTPRLVNRIYSEYQKELLVAKAQSGANVDEAAIRRRFKYSFGDRLQCMTLGGAATPKQVVSFAKHCFEIPVYVGYASTEAGSICWLEESSDYHTSSFKKFDADLKLIDCPELNYFTSSDPPQGEICVKSTSVFSGYYKDDDQTKKAFTEDGYFKTGDIGEKTKNGYRIIDRKNNAVKLSQGEFIVTSRLEDIFLQSVFVDQVFIYGDSMHAFPVALIIPQRDAVAQWALQNGHIQVFGELSLPTVSHDLAVQKGQTSSTFLLELHSMLQVDLNRIGLEEKLQAYEIPQGILLDNEPFTDENRRLTGTHKVCHPELKKHYGDYIQELYNHLETRQPEEILLAAIGEVLGIDLHSQESADKYAACSFSDLGGDSLSASKLNSIIGMSSLEIPSHLLLKEDLTIADLRRFVKQMTRFSLEHETTLSEEFDIRTTLEPPPPMSALAKSAEYILLTGVTGFLGAYILRSIISRFSSLRKVYCLVRGNSDEECQRRVTTCLHERGMNSLPENKIHVIRGDLTLRKFGLSEQLWNELAENVHVVFHNGAQVNAAFSYNDLRQANVEGTLEVLRLCGEKRAKHIHFTSTVGVLGGGSDTKGYPSHPEKDLDGYSLTKYVAESLLHTARASRGFMVTIYRPELVSGDSSTGFLNATDWLTILMSGCIQCGYYPDEDWIIQSVPVDYCCHALVSLSCLDSSTNQTLHLVNPLEDQCCLTVRSLFECINTALDEEKAPKMHPLPFASWLAHLKSLRAETTSSSNPLVKSMALFERGLPTEMVHYSTSAKLILQQSILDRKCPPVNTSQIVAKYVRSMAQMGLLQSSSAGSLLRRDKGE